MVEMNGVTLQSMTYNGVEVQSWTHDGVEVYSGFRPFYVIENGLLVEGNYTSAERVEANVIQQENTNYGRYGVTDWSGNTHYAGAVVKFKRGKANKLRFKGTAYVDGGKRYELFIYGDGVQLNYSYSYTDVTIEKVFDLGEYNEITVNYKSIASADNSGVGVGATITELYCYQQE